MRIHAFTRCTATLAIGGLAAHVSHAQAPEPYPLGQELRVPAPSDAPPAEPTGALWLRDALALALLHNPELAAISHEVRAAEAALIQAGAHPNPSVSLELEDFGGSGELGGLDSAQTTLLLGQVIELGGKRAARIGVASAARDLAAWEHEVRRIEILSQTAAAFVEVLAAQERHRLAGESLALARSLQSVAAQRARAGSASEAEEIRAGVAVDVAGVEREHTEHELATARQILAAHWAGTRARFARADGDLEALPAVPTDAQLADWLETSPDVARWETERAQREALRARARSARIPDVAVGLGPRRLHGIDESALVLDLSVPLPLWDRNRGGIEETEHRIAKAAMQARAARVRTATQLATAHAKLVASIEEAGLLRARVLPGTERAVAALQRGYAQGRLTQVEVLDAERARLAAREQYLRALTEAHHSAQEIERLTGRPLEVRR